jgi:hypothetical protein
MVNINLPNDYKTATHSTSLSGSSYSSGAPLSNVNIDPSLAGVIEAQQQKIKIFKSNLPSSIKQNIKFCQQTQAGERM